MSLSLFLVIVALGCMSTASGFYRAERSVNYDAYVPGPKVKQYTKQDFLQPALMDYLIKVVIIAAPVFGIGIITYIIFVLWSCYRSMKCCKACKQPDQFSKPLRFFLLILVVLLLLGCMGMIFFGFQGSNQVKQSMTNTKDLLTSVITQRDKVVTVDVSLYNQLTELDTKCTQFQTAYPVDLSSITSPISSMKSASSGINSTINSESLTIQINDIKTQVDMAEALRIKIITGVLVGILVLIIIQTLISLLDSFRAPGEKPSDKCCLITWWITSLYLLVNLLLWIVSGVLLVVVVLLADVCIDPSKGINSQLKQDSTSLLYYFMYCDVNLTLVNPLDSQKQSITSGFDALSNSFNSYNPGGCTGQCATDLQAIKNLLLVDIKGSFDGLLAFVNCTFFNNMYRSILHLLCDDIFLPLASFFEVFLAVAVLMTILEFLRRKLPGGLSNKVSDFNHDVLA